MFKFREESETDCIEYKENIIKMYKEKFERYITQMNSRLFFGKGKCYYYIGVKDDGNIKGLNSCEILISLFNLLSVMSQLDKVYCEKAQVILFKEIKSYIMIVSIVSNHYKYSSPSFITYSESDSDTEYD
jgi:GTPase